MKRVAGQDKSQALSSGANFVQDNFDALLVVLIANRQAVLGALQVKITGDDEVSLHANKFGTYRYAPMACMIK